jgi:GNAT superfamily N-acetyltransferase
MQESLKHVDFAEIRGEIRAHLAGLPNAIESYLESHILGSTHYRLMANGQNAGIASIHNQSLITQFAVDEPFRHLGQALFTTLKRTEHVQFAYVSSGDEFFLAHALDEHRTIATQAYFFSARAEAVAVPPDFRLVPATMADVARIRAISGDFLDPIEERIGRDELFLMMKNDDLAGFGIREVSTLYDDVASIGMFTLPDQRGGGAGTATIALLIADTQRRGPRPVAGCWFYNHASKRTLERAGLAATSRLFKIGF